MVCEELGLITPLQDLRSKESETEKATFVKFCSVLHVKCCQMSRMTFLLKLGESVRYRNYKYAPLKGLDTRCVAKATSEVSKKPCASSASKKDSPCKNKL